MVRNETRCWRSCAQPPSPTTRSKTFDQYSENLDRSYEALEDMAGTGFLPQLSSYDVERAAQVRFANICFSGSS